jgi:preprotein translocase subunit SecE
MLRVRILPGLHLFPSRGKELVLRRIINFLKESRAELKKVNWPSREEVFTSTRVVIISILIIAAAIALVDYVIKTVVFAILGG